MSCAFFVGVLFCCISFLAAFTLFLATFSSTYFVEIDDGTRWGLWSRCPNTTSYRNYGCEMLSPGEGGAYFEVARTFSCFALVLHVVSVVSARIAVQTGTDTGSGGKAHVITIVLSLVILGLEGGILGAIVTYYADDERWKDRSPTLGYCNWMLVASISASVLALVSLLVLACCCDKYGCTKDPGCDDCCDDDCCDDCCDDCECRCRPIRCCDAPCFKKTTAVSPTTTTQLSHTRLGPSGRGGSRRSSSSSSLSVVSRSEPVIPAPALNAPPRRLPRLARTHSDITSRHSRQIMIGQRGVRAPRQADTETPPPGYTDTPPPGYTETPPPGYVTPPPTGSQDVGSRGQRSDPALPILTHPSYNFYPYPEDDIQGVAPPSYDEIMGQDRLPENQPPPTVRHADSFARS